MPSTRIIIGIWTRGRELQIIEAVQSALLASLKIPDRDSDVVLDTYESTARITPTDRSERYSRVKIAISRDGRSMRSDLSTKRWLPISQRLVSLRMRSRSFSLRYQRIGV
jgi:hypothetical protein